MCLKARKNDRNTCGIETSVLAFPPNNRCISAMTYSKDSDGKTEIGPIAARGGVRGNGVIYVLVIGVVLAIIVMFFAVKLFH
jgi:hypothetical protein